MKKILNKNNTIAEKRNKYMNYSFPKTAYLVGLLFFVIGTTIYLKGGSETKLSELLANKTNQPDTLNLNKLALEEIIFLLGQASILEKDSIDSNKFKSFLIQSKISKYIQKNLDQGEFDRNHPQINFIINFLNGNGYLITPDSPTNLAKLIHYLSTGNYPHIWNRIVGRNYHIYFFGLVFIFSIVIILFKYNLMNKIMKKHIALFILFLVIGNTIFAQKTEQIPFEKSQNGLMYFHAAINGLKGKFLFDTGASGVVINPDFFHQMKSQGLISQADYLGNTDVIGINNIKVNVEVYNIKSLSVDSFRVYDLQAFIMPDTNAQLIIGQSVFEKLGKVAIDNQNKILIIEVPAYTINEIRYVPCSNQNIQQIPDISQALDSTLTISNISVETNVPPPANAVNRIDKGITIRYFDADTKDIADFIRSELEQMDAYKNVQINIENMLPFMKMPIKNYMEIWLK